MILDAQETVSANLAENRIEADRTAGFLVYYIHPARRMTRRGVIVRETGK